MAGVQNLILDTLRPTSTGLDHLPFLPSWFLRLGAPVFCKPLARLSVYCHVDGK